MLDYTSLPIICNNSKLYHVALSYMIAMTCIYSALCKNIMSYIHACIYSLSKYGIITLTVETF